MNNRGQIYIIAALILSVAIFLLVSQTNFVQRILFEDDFEQISKNFDVESAKFMNSLLAKESDISMDYLKGEFIDFTNTFTEYAKVENPEFEFIYVLDYKDKSLVGYYLQTEDVEFRPQLADTSGEVTSGQDCIGDFCLTVAIPRLSKVEEGKIDSIKIRDMQYNLNIVPGVPQLVIISREEKGNQTKVFLNEEFVTGVKVL